MTPNSLENLIKLIAKLPGLGTRSARRIALQLLQQKENLMLPLAEALKETASEIKECEKCSNLDVTSPCSICSDPKRDPSIVCVVEGVADLWAMERGNCYKGLYHILGGTLSALDGRTPESLNFEALKQRVANDSVGEVIIATNATLEGQTTSHYVADMLKPYGIKASRIAHGIPMGGELDYLDEGTLTLAIKLRQDF